MASMRHSATSSAHERHAPGMLRPVPHPLVAVILGLAAILVVAAFGFLLAKKPTVTSSDLGVDQFLSRHHVGYLTAIAHGIYLGFSPIEAVAIGAVVTLIVLLVSRNWRTAVTFALAVLLSWLSSDVVKILVHRPRPLASELTNPFLPTPSDPSFPSGHVVFATSLAVTFIFLARGSAGKSLAIVLGIALVLIVGSAVLYLGVHYPTDVIGSVLWGTGAVVVFLTLWNGLIIPRTYRRKRS